MLQDIAGLQRRTEQLMAEKEQLMLSFAYHKVPKPYYVRWKQEVNATFAQAVAIDLRRRAIARRAADKAKAAAAKAKTPA